MAAEAEIIITPNKTEETEYKASRDDAETQEMRPKNKKTTKKKVC